MRLTHKLLLSIFVSFFSQLYINAALKPIQAPAPITKTPIPVPVAQPHAPITTTPAAVIKTPVPTPVQKTALKPPAPQAIKPPTPAVKSAAATATKQEEPEEIRYGDRIVLKHKTTGLYLNGITQQVLNQPTASCSGQKSNNSYWMVKGPHKANSPINCVLGNVVKRGDNIRLEHVATGKNLNSTTLDSKLSGQKIVGLNGVGGIGDTSDNWQIKTDTTVEDPTVLVGDEIKIVHSLDNKILHASATVRNTDGTTEVNGTSTDSNDNLWIVDSFEAYIVTPAGFTREYELTAAITCGSQTTGGSANLQVWCLSEDRTKLRMYNPSSMTENPWTDIAPIDDKGKAVTGTIEDLSIASDGTFAILLTSGGIYMYNWDKKNFTLLQSQNPAPAFDEISIGNKTDIFAVNKATKTLYQYDRRNWTVIDQGNTESVAAGLDGTVVVLKNGIPNFYNGNRQYEAMGNTALENIAVGNASNIIGSTESGELMHYDTTKKRWVSFLDSNGNLTTGIKEVAINAAGCIFVTSRSGEIYNNGETSYVIRSVSAASEADKKENKNIKIVSGMAKQPAANQSRYQAKRSGRITIRPKSEQQTAGLKKAPAKRKRKVRKSRRIGKLAGATQPVAGGQKPATQRKTGGAR